MIKTINYITFFAVIACFCALLIAEIKPIFKYSAYHPFTMIVEAKDLAHNQKLCASDENCMDIMTFNQLPECFPKK